ncbi:hypothetical protein BN1708_015107 [Verticillium longisporum]|uniref:WD40 domain-containing protein n=1 Tax=Verticillium longisporum TaxID=100787 RepID=A0A0G4M2W7_VERLO|nr:hypothetical protein BN1708_015107 [Verticillium longisporum]
MHFTRAFKSSPHCIASPDGTLVATLLSSRINVRSVQSLETINTIALPSDIAGSVFAFQWSPSSTKLLVALAEQIHVFSAVREGFHATLRVPASATSRPTLIQFGATDSEVCVSTQFGLKFTIFDLAASRSIEINNPKFHHASSAPRGFSFRPVTSQLALLTRVAGKDVISIHTPVSREVERSWSPETVDAQSLQWSPDGRWLVLWESPSQQHKVLFYTPDGHLFKEWSGPSGFTSDVKDHELGAGVKLCHLSSDASRAAICDYTRHVYILDLAAVTDALRLQHPTLIVPKDTVQIWQEQITFSETGLPAHSFVRATQTVTAPTRSVNSTSGSSQEAKTGCAAVSFDSSTVLAATKMEDSPSTLWIWDLSSSELRAVLIFHGDVSTFSWHPTIRELLLVSCEGEGYGGLLFTWDPLSDGPRAVDFAFRLPPTSKSVGKPRVAWVTRPGEPPVVLFSDSTHTVLASLGDSDEHPAPWQDAHAGDVTLDSSRVDTPSGFAHIQGLEVASSGVTNEDLSAMDDTFSFRKI